MTASTLYNLVHKLHTIRAVFLGFFIVFVCMHEYAYVDHVYVFLGMLEFPTG